MTQGSPKHSTESPALIERRIRKIANARSITLALATTFVGVTSAVIQRSQDKRHEEERAQEIQDLQRLIETLGEIRAAIDGLERRLS